MKSTNREHPILQLKRFAAGEANSEERQEVVRHLLKGCASCAGELRKELAPQADLQALSDAVDRVLERSHELIQLTEERRVRAGQGIESLESLSRDERESWIDALSAAERVPVVEMLLARSRDLRHESSIQHLQWSELALRAAQGAPSEARPELQARAWAELGNAHRLPGNLTAAKEALREAREQLQQVSLPDSRESLAQAEIANVEAALAHDLRDYDRAAAGYEEARRLYQEMGEDERALSCALSLALIVAGTGKPAEGIRRVNELLAREELDQESPYLRGYALTILADLHLDLGEVERASDLAEQAWSVAGEDYRYLDQLRFQWLFGQLAREKGEMEKAATLLEGCRQSYIEEERTYEVALVALDLASVYIRLGSWSELGGLVQETAQIFRSLGIARESIMALTMLNQLESAEALDTVARLIPAVKRSRLSS